MPPTSIRTAAGSAKLLSRREPAAIDNQTVIRLNRDTLYTSGVFDLDAAPVTVTLPDAGKRFMSLQAISEDHYARTFYGSEHLTPSPTPTLARAILPLPSVRWSTPPIRRI